MLCVGLMLWAGGELEVPFQARAGGAPVDVGGHAAPLVADFDGDGREDLLVGQNWGGSLEVFRNGGKCGAPEFGEGEWVRGGAQVLGVPPG